MKKLFEFELTNPSDVSIVPLIEELSQNLKSRFDSDGKNSFQHWEENNSKFIFIGLKLNNEYIGCGAIRPISEHIGEVKRMYSKYKSIGIGSTVLAILQDEAKKAGYEQLCLETREKNIEACNFYQKHGFVRIKNYGQYKDKPQPACFGKAI
ncbi:GNAT family N-acetyltransferase [Solitalea sp. MAHUQ-68]|uniref:GNAT family N-acetyltransferase n=1 Tax=Solitalea agri TaxID=2953739 RepID=A0A9X2JAR1_9SPHI|nr:GNAT family N-acetyltransferase [Solitalea agri]MCO4291712.1 GNAT family N-acetyltransferase [Solitalea agri]